MTTVILDYSNFESVTWNNLYEIMGNRTNIPDPRGSASESARTMIYDSDPLEKGMAFQDVPYIVIHLPTLEYRNFGVDARYKWLKFVHRIIVRTKKEGSGNNKVDTGRSDMQSITNAMQMMFNNLTIKQQFDNLWMHNVILKKVSTDTIIIDQRILYESQFELSYDNRFKVVA
jgi:hypothetical protein